MSNQEPGNLKWNKTRKSKDADNGITEIPELPDKDFKAAIMKILQ